MDTEFRQSWKARQRAKDIYLQNLDEEVTYDVARFMDHAGFRQVVEELSVFFEGPNSIYNQTLRYFAIAFLALIEMGALVIDSHTQLDTLLLLPTFVMLVSLFQVVQTHQDLNQHEHRLFTDLRVLGFAVPPLHWPSLRLQYLDMVYEAYLLKISEYQEVMNQKLLDRRGEISLGADGELIFAEDEVDADSDEQPKQLRF